MHVLCFKHRLQHSIVPLLWLPQVLRIQMLLCGQYTPEIGTLTRVAWSVQLVRRRTRADVMALMLPPETAVQALERVRRQVRPAVASCWPSKS